MRKGRIVFCLLIVGVAAVAIYLAHDWPFKAALFPLAVSVPLVILGSLHLLQLIRAKEDTVESAAVDLEFTNDLPPELERRRVIGTFSWIAGFILCVYLIGFPPTVPLFILVYLRFESRGGWLWSFVVAVITWVGFYGLFQKLVHLPFEQGLIQTWVGM